MVTSPRLLRGLLARLAPRDLRDSMLDDLDELFQRRAAARGTLRARIWYTREALLAIPHLAALRAYRWSSRRPLEPGMTAFDTLVQDVRLALRLFRRFPGSTSAAVATLALCIGANTAVFSLLEAVLVRPLPYADPGRLIVIWNAAEPGEVTHISLREVLGYGSGSPSVPHLAGYIEHSATFVDGDDPERVRAATVTTNAFETLGVQPLLGRAFHTADGEPGAPATIVLGHALWTRQFGARADIVGTVIRVSGTPRTVLGVMPEGFRLPLDFRAPRPTEAWLPMEVDPANLGGWGSRSIVGFGRLKGGVEPTQATGEFAVIADRWVRAGFVVDQGDGRMQRRAVPMNDLIAGDARRALLLLFGAVAAVLVIACATVANVLLARADARRQEIAVRAALGAGRRRIARQLLTESALMAGASGALGVAVAYVSVRLLKTLPATTVPRAEGAAIDATVLLFVIAATLATLLLFGLVPALQLSRPDLARTLNAGGRGARGGTGRFRRGLVVTQLAVAVVLVVVAGLLARSLVEMYRIDLGFDPRRVLTAHTFLPVADYPTDGDVVRTFREIEQRLASLPGAKAAGAVRVLPLARTIGDWSIVIEGRPFVREENPNTDFQSATPGYFSAMGIALARGRLYTHADDERAPLVTVINETMAERYWPGEDPIGKRFHLSTADVPWLTIVGVVRTVRHNAVIEEPRAEAYIPHAQLAREIGSATRAMTLVLKTEADPLSMAGAMRTAVRGVGRYLPLAEVQTMEHVTAAALSQPRFTAMLLGVLAALALVLAALGIYSTVSLLVSERTREIGIRVALGASRRSVLRLVVGEGATLALGGLAVGIAGALAATRLLQGLLYGVEPLDAATFAAAPVLLGTLAVLACLNPARRATRVDPVVALRHG